MKKSLVALAVLAAAGAASAQSSVTLFGVVDASISSVSNKSELIGNANPFAPFSPATLFLPNSVKSSKTGLNNSAYNSSRIGFRGTEDLGGGLAASFWLEGALGNDEGQAGGSVAYGSNTIGTGASGLFNRRSTVSLSGGFGELRLGRDYKPTFWNYTVFDPFGTNGSGTNVMQKAAGGFETSNVRANNTVGYFLPSNLGGFYGQLQYSFSEQAKFDSNAQGVFNNESRGGRYVGGRFGYANGPLDVAVAYSEQINTSNFNLGTNSDAKNLNVGASWDFGVVKLFGQVGQIKSETEFSGNNSPIFNPSTKLKGYLLGATVPVGPGLIRASYSAVKISVDNNPLLLNPFVTTEDPKANQFALGYVHNLSKRTALYATATYVKNKNGAGYTAGSSDIDVPFVATYTNSGFTGAYRPKSSMGYDLGIRHSF
jgi:predicted porin